MQNTIDGNSSTARIVVGLVDTRGKSKSELRKLKKAALEIETRKSVARDLATDPPWTDDDIDHSAGDAAVSEEERRNADDPQNL